MQPGSISLHTEDFPENSYCPSINCFQLFPCTWKAFLLIAEYQRARDKKTIIPIWIIRNKRLPLDASNGQYKSILKNVETTGLLQSFCSSKSNWVKF